MKATCEYCEHEGEFGEEIEVRKYPDGTSLFACVDRDECDHREHAKYDRRIRELRKVQRHGEELTEAERQELGE